MRSSLALLLVAACNPSVEGLQALSAGSIGCPQNEVLVSHEQEVNSFTTSWQADCRGRSFVCSISGKHQISCSPMLPPVEGAQVAGGPAPAAAPPTPDEAAKACADAAEYDKKAAASSSPAKEQLEKIAAHKHRDCDAAKAAPAPVAPPAASAPAAAPTP